MHLDVSECYLLERMPKGIDTLDSLQVLKGFLIGSSKNTPCRLGDLRSLKRLRRLSIYIGNDAEIQGGQLKGMSHLFVTLRVHVRVQTANCKVVQVDNLLLL
jgi:hypothetical protein